VSAHKMEGRRCDGLEAIGPQIRSLSNVSSTVETVLSDAIIIHNVNV